MSSQESQQDDGAANRAQPLTIATLIVSQNNNIIIFIFLFLVFIE